MKKVKGLLKNKKGVTIVESLLCLVLLTILSVLVISSLSPVLKMYVRANESAEANMLLSSISDEIVTSLTRASAVKLNAGELNITTGIDQVTYTVESDGILYRKGRQDTAGQQVLDKDYYKGKTITVGYLDESGSPLTDGSVTKPFFVEVKVISPKIGGEMASRKFAVNPLGLQLS